MSTGEASQNTVQHGNEYKSGPGKHRKGTCWTHFVCIAAGEDHRSDRIFSGTLSGTRSLVLRSAMVQTPASDSLSSCRLLRFLRTFLVYSQQVPRSVVRSGVYLFLRLSLVNAHDSFAIDADVWGRRMGRLAARSGTGKLRSARFLNLFGHTRSSPWLSAEAPVMLQKRVDEKGRF